MRQSMEQSAPSPYKQDIINRYEELRDLSLKKTISFSNSSLGLSVLLFRGMAVWMETCLSLELLHSSQEKPSYFETTDNSNKAASQHTNIHPCLISLPTRTEALMILTNMIMHQQEVRNN